MLLVTSNGTGMGHVMRQAAVARALADRADAVLLSLSSGLALAAGDLRCEYLPSYQRPWIPRHEWDRYLASRVTALVREIGADVVAFDGVAPYWGLVRAAHDLPDVSFVWFRRGMWRPGRNGAALRATRYFDRVIEPGDLGEAFDRGLTRGLDAQRIPPVSMLDVLELLSREDAAAALGLDPGDRNALVTLGSGAVGDDDATSTAAVAELRGAGYSIATTRAALGGSSSVPTDALVLSGVYPMAAYVRAFDLVVSAAGYNAVHEFVTAGVPTVLVPNTSTVVDDQQARAAGVAALGAAVVADPARGRVGLTEAIRAAISRAPELARRASETGAQRGPGAQAAADALLDLVPVHARASIADRTAFALQGAVETSSAVAQSVVGRERLRRWARRRPESPTPARRLQVDLEVDDDLADLVPLAWQQPSGSRRARMTSRLDGSVRTATDPIEHVLAGASPAYVEARIAIARGTYDVRHLVRGAVS